MKKLVLLFVFLPIIVFAGPLQRAHLAVIGAGNAEEGSNTTLEFVIAASDDEASNNTLTVASGSLTGLADNDIMIAFINRHRQEDSITNPTNWNSANRQGWGSNNQVELWWKVASSESGDYTWTFPNNQRSSLTIAVYRGGFDTTDPIDQLSTTQYTTSNTTARAAGITISANDSPLLVIGGAYNSASVSATAPSSPSGFLEDVDYSNTSGDHQRFFYSQTEDSGATGDMDVTLSANPSTATCKHAYGLSLNPD